jgi:hypothetical protein
VTPTFLIMSILVRDEADIIGENLEWHRRQGVDRFVVIDHGSTDGTTEILKDFAQRFPLDLMRRDDPVVQQAVWTREMIRKARRQYGHVWHIANDADEFYIPPPGDTLKTYLAKRMDSPVLEVSRRNVIFAREELAQRGWQAASTWQSVLTETAPEGMEDPKVFLPHPFEYYWSNPKVVFQVQGLKYLTKGAHRADMDPPCEPSPCGLQILHWPFRNPQEFLTSARRLGQSAREDMAKNPNKQISHRYRRWLAMLEDGQPETNLLDEAMPDQARLERDRAAGVLMPLSLPPDLAGFLAKRAPAPRAKGLWSRIKALPHRRWAQVERRS